MYASARIRTVVDANSSKAYQLLDAFPIDLLSIHYIYCMYKGMKTKLSRVARCSALLSKLNARANQPSYFSFLRFVYVIRGSENSFYFTSRSAYRTRGTYSIFIYKNEVTYSDWITIALLHFRNTYIVFERM